mgnify:CR=1 FL=1
MRFKTGIQILVPVAWLLISIIAHAVTPEDGTYQLSSTSFSSFQAGGTARFDIINGEIVLDSISSTSTLRSRICFRDGPNDGELFASTTTSTLETFDFKKLEEGVFLVSGGVVVTEEGELDRVEFGASRPMIGHITFRTPTEADFVFTTAFPFFSGDGTGMDYCTVVSSVDFTKSE